MFRNNQAQKSKSDSTVIPRVEHRLEGHISGVTALTLLLDGRLASGSWREIRVWNIERRECTGG